MTLWYILLYSIIEILIMKQKIQSFYEAYGLKSLVKEREAIHIFTF